MRDLVVGFDLDMTLVDSGEGIVDTVLHVCERHGVRADADLVRAGVGLPLDRVFPELLPDVPYDQALAEYRARYLSHVVPGSRALPGAAQALAAVRDAGGRVVVVTAKKAEHAELVLAGVQRAVTPRGLRAQSRAEVEAQEIPAASH